uniref:Uncharacterized protein n=1 Tax=Lepeophtheirus salmonis TaxID=72036 RepID=A0A0K2TE96_LEPSM
MYKIYLVDGPLYILCCSLIASLPEMLFLIYIYTISDAFMGQDTSYICSEYLLFAMRTRSRMRLLDGGRVESAILFAYFGFFFFLK